MLRLKARQADDRVIIEISDDGRGIDRTRVLAKAKQLGVLEAEVEAAAELDAATRQRLEEELARTLGARRVRLAVRVRPELLGGLVVKVGDRRLDASLRRRLLQLHRQLATGGGA